MRLIDANALIKKWENVHSKDMSFAMAVIGAINDVKKAPTVDAVPLIRCKDCKHYDGYYCHNEWWGDGHGNYTPPIKSEDGFCDWAEGKENGKID